MHVQEVHKASKILGLLSRGDLNARKYSLVKVIENDCIVTRVKVYDEKWPEPSGNPSNSGNISACTPPLVTIQLQLQLYIYIS